MAVWKILIILTATAVTKALREDYLPQVVKSRDEARIYSALRLRFLSPLVAWITFTSEVKGPWAIGCSAIVCGYLYFALFPASAAKLVLSNEECSMIGYRGGRTNSNGSSQ